MSGCTISDGITKIRQVLVRRGKLDGVGLDGVDPGVQVWELTVPPAKDRA